ncbi:MAG: hypothetical protein ACE15C_19185 [Phycisphaerae bacterium]
MSFGRGAIILAVRIRSCLGAFGPAALQLFLEGSLPDGPVWDGRNAGVTGRGLIARLPLLSGAFAIRHAPLGHEQSGQAHSAQAQSGQAQSGQVVGEGRFERRPHGGRITLPAPVLSPADRIFVKIDRRFGFFDEAGWCEFPFLARRGQDAATRLR